MSAVELSEKQSDAWHLLTEHDNGISTVLYGGAAGGGKTWFGCLWQITMRLNYPGTRGLIGRNTLKGLKETTLNTFFEVAKLLGKEVGKDFTYNQTAGLITFTNGSTILLKDLSYKPSDPEVQALGGIEITDAFIDEAGEINEKVFNTVQSRIRYKLSENKLTAKLLLCSNPAKSWLYNQFWKPYRDDTLLPHRQFVQALVTDNPDPQFVAAYTENLKRLDPVSISRLLLGDWDYSDDALALFDRSAIDDLFNQYHVQGNGKYYLSCDIARYGSDLTVIGVWNGNMLEDIVTMEQNDIVQAANTIRGLMQRYSIGGSRVVIDADGVGGGVSDILRGTRQFVNNSKPIKVAGKDQQYQNLKTQCYYKLAEVLESRQFGISDKVAQKMIKGETVQSLISEELGAIRRANVDKDGKLAIEGKDRIKAIIGRSPDLADMLAMRCIFEFVSKTFGVG